MDIENIYDSTMKEIAKLEEKEEFQKRKKCINEYNALTKEIEEQQSKIDALLNQEAYDEAAAVKINIGTLEAKALLMKPMYDSYVSAPDYNEDDLIAISHLVARTLDEALIEMDKEQKELIEKYMDIQQKKALYSKDAQWIRKRLIQLAGVHDFKGSLKFKRIPEISIANVNYDISKYIGNYKYVRNIL